MTDDCIVCSCGYWERWRVYIKENIVVLVCDECGNEVTVRSMNYTKMERLDSN